MGNRLLVTADEFVGLIAEDSTPHRVLRSIEGKIVVDDRLRVLRHLPDNCIDLIHTSPPYNIDKPYAHGERDRTTQPEYEAFLEETITELTRVLRPGGSVFWQTGYTQHPNHEALGILPIDIISYRYFVQGDVKMALWDRIIWRYWGGHAFRKKFTNKHETILWFVKPGSDPFFDVDEVRERSKEYDKRNNFWGRNPGNVWEVDRVAAGSTEQTSHIAVFPEEVSERIIRACSRAGDLVLDPFSGSGTVPKVAHSLKRRWIGIEVSSAYAQESSVRVGFQQPCEADALTSEIIKGVAFHGRPGTLTVDEIVGKVSIWLSQTSIEKLAHKLGEDVASALADTSTSRSRKRATWMEYDERIAHMPSSDPIALADSLLSRSYKNRRNLNGVSRYKTAMDILQEVVRIMCDASEHWTKYVLRVMSQEPSSYVYLDGRVTLMAVDRKVKASEEELGDSDPDGADEMASAHQGRLGM